MLDHSITNHMAPSDLYETLNLISEDFSVPRVVTCLFWSLNKLSTSI